jgi:hypothetical protein
MRNMRLNEHWAGVLPARREPVKGRFLAAGCALKTQRRARSDLIVTAARLIFH